MATYSTSSECATYAGMPSIGTTTRPTEAMVDEWRTDAYALIVEVIGPSKADVNGICKAIERKLVKIMIDNIVYKKAEQGTERDMEISESDKQRLITTFEQFGISTWDPDEDGVLSG